MTENRQSSILPESANIGACMDVKAYNGFLYAIQRRSQTPGGRLCVLTPSLTCCHTFTGIGNARQIEIIDQTAVITAREDGIFLFDLSDPVPRLLCHYKTVEYATGVTLWQNLALISCRQYGIEILDLSDPAAPKHIGLIRVGEVQSATVSDGILYCGVWGKMKVVVVDIHDIGAPTILTEIPLMGRGDGVHVKNGILYAATGQHKRGIQNVTDHSDPAFGKGNGVECFDVRDPHHPIRLSGAFLGEGYCTAVDMWEPALYGDTLVVNNSVLGVFGLDPRTLVQKFHFPPPPCLKPENAVTGVTVLHGDLFVATAYGDLYAYRGLGLSDAPKNIISFPISTIPHPLKSTQTFGNATLAVRYCGNFAVLAACKSDSCIALACGNGGIHLLSAETLAPIFQIPTAGIAEDVAICGNLLYVANGEAGLEIFRLMGSSASRIGHFRTDQPISQLSLSESGDYLLCICGSTEAKMLNVKDPTAVTESYHWKPQKGPFYGNNLATARESDGTMLFFCHQDGLVYTNPDCGDTAFHVVYYKKKCGFCGYCAGEGIETDGTHILYTASDGYTILPKEPPEYFENLPIYRHEILFKGLLTLCDPHLLIAANRARGIVTAVDISDLKKPKPIAQLETSVSPSKAIVSNGRILLPSGHGGLLELCL